MTNKNNKISHEYFAESAVATFIVTPNCEVIFWNKACEELTGVKASEVMFTNDHWVAFYKSKRSCLVDIVIDGNFHDLPNLYEKYGKSNLSKEGIHAEGWYENLGGKKRYIVFDAAPIFNDAGELLAGIETLHDITELKNSEREKEGLLKKLITDIAHNKTLRGFIPICSSCKNIRDKQGEWLAFEGYFDKKLDIRFSHGLCPKCARQLYPDLFDKMK